jgi:class 3 adenylate cyclase/tetratricopeptide (TPR) repeat protein
MRDVGAASERSIITVLSVDMVDSTSHIAACDPDDAQAFLDRWFDHVSAGVERAGGLLVNFGGDGGLAVFGWPSPLEDHADRACLAAWDIQHPNTDSPGPDGEPVRFRVGVHSGLVGLRRLRREGRARFDTVGATVNIAAKLQQSAPSGGILVSAATVKLCHSPLELTAQGSPEKPGKVSPQVFRLEARPDETVGSNVARRYRLPIVGRRDELARVSRALPRPGRKSASIALIGEAGIGKSRLAAAAIADAGDVEVLVFYGDPQKRTTPFAAARSLITDLVHLHGEVTPERLRDALANASLDENDLRALESLLAPLPVRARARAAELTQTQIARSLATFCARSVTRPTLLLIEDLHLVDSESRQFLRLFAVTKTARPVCLLITGRPEALHDAREITQTVIRLEPLARQEMEDLGRQLWPDGQPPDWLLSKVIERADGVPFVLEELIRSVDVDAYQPLPHRVESVIHARLHRLPRSAKAVAQALSLLGEEVEIEFARAVLGCDMRSMLDDLSELDRFAFVHPIVGHSTRFRHQIIAEACVDTIPRERRAQLHGAAIQAITSRFPDLRGRYKQLAFHAEGAGDDRAALGYLWNAGVEARGTSASASLNLIFDRALILIDRIGADAEKTYVDFVLMAFASMLLLGEFDKMRSHLPHVMALARRHNRPDKVSNALSQLGMLCWFEGRYEEGLRATEEGLAIALELKAPPLIYANQIMLANVLPGLGRVERALKEVGELVEMLTGELESARWGSPSIPRSTALSFTGWFLLETGRYLEALEFGHRGLEIAVREHDPYSEVLARNAMGRALLLLERNEEAVTCLAVARELAETNGYDAVKANLAGYIAAALARTGRASEAIAIVEECMRAELHLRTGQMEVYCLRAGYAEALVRAGKPQRGLRALADALAIARAIDNPCLIASGLGLRARLLSAITPDDPGIEADLREQAKICEAYRLAAWAPATVRGTGKHETSGQASQRSYVARAKAAGLPH